MLKTLNSAAFAVSLVAPAIAFAGGHEASGGDASAPRRGPPPAAISQMNLGKAGLLSSFYSGSQFGVTQSRGGEDATRIGSAGGSGVENGYKHESASLITSFTGRKLIDGGTSYLTFGFGTNNKQEQPNLTEFETSITSISIGYQNFSDPNSAYGAQLIVGDRSTTNGTVDSDRKTTEFRLDYARKLNDDWGVTSRLHYTTGDLIVSTPGGTSTEKQNVIYTQVELVGAFGSDELGFVPDGWVLHPTFGLSFNRDTVQADAGDEVNDTGALVAKGTFVKPARPGSWSQNYTLGVEHVFLHDRDAFIDEETYAILGAGAQHMGKTGNTFNISYERRQGLNGNRIGNSIVATYSVNF